MTDDKPLPQATPQEPSMENILASIRRILSDDGVNVAGESERPAAAGAKGEARSEPRARVKPDRAPSDAEQEIELAEPPARATVSEPTALPVLHLTPDMRVADEQVVSPETSMVSTDVLSQLAKAILDCRDISLGARDITLESMVREMLRPLLKEWLDRNLPYLIERLVKSEIDRMVKRAERLGD